jgi:calcineurin-like phosphoesterase family protein
MKTWITSDTHWGHKNIMKFCPETRGHFKDVAHMNSEMIRMWNEKVEPGDLVYILGDVAFCSASDAAKILQSLNGDKILVEGNHDNKSVKDVSFRNCFKEIHKYLEVNYNGTKVVMFHYPITEWNQVHRGSVHFYGHLHQNVSGLEKYRARNAGWDCTGNIVTLIDDLIADALKGEIKGHHA